MILASPVCNWAMIISGQFRIQFRIQSSLDIQMRQDDFSEPER